MDAVSSETHADFDGLLNLDTIDTVYTALVPDGCRIGSSTSGVHLSGPPQHLLDWLDTITAQVGVNAHDNGAESVWFTFDTATQRVAVTLKQGRQL